MKSNLFRLLALVLCFCALLTFVACGKVENKAPTEDDTKQPSADITDEPTVPNEPDVPVEPNVPTEPSTPTEPEKPIEPAQPSGPEKPTEPEITWDAEGYQNIVDNYENKALAVYGNKAMVATEDKVQLFYVEYENTTPVMKKYKEFDFSVEKLLVNEHTFGFITTDGDLYQYITFEDGHENGQPTKIMENVKNAVFGIASGMAVKNDGTLWGWENDRIIGTQIFYSLGEPFHMAEGIKDFVISRSLNVRVYTNKNEFCYSYGSDRKAEHTDVKKYLEGFVIKTDNALYVDTYDGAGTYEKVLDFVGQSTIYNGYFVTDREGTIWEVSSEYWNYLKKYKADKSAIFENCLYLPQYVSTEDAPFCYIDTEHNLWAINAKGEKHLVDTDVIYVPAITTHLWYVKNDNTIWVDGKYVMDMENTIPISPNAAEEPEITVAPKPPKASYADAAAKAIADAALGKVKFYDTTTKTFITVDEYEKQEGEQKNFYVMDIDQDGAEELILRPYSLPVEKNILVLHYDGKQVNGYRIVSGDWRTMRGNGVAESINEDYDVDALITACFKNYEMIIERVAEKKLDEQWNLYRYYVNGEETAKENFELQYKIWEEQEYISFYELSEENIEKAFIKETVPAEPIVITPEAAKAAIRDVLLGKAQFFDTGDKRYTTLPEERVRREAILNEGEDRPDWYRTYSYNRFALVDLDHDGALECIIESSMYHIEGYKVLHFDGEKVNMHDTIYRGWDGIKVDGTAYGNGVVITYFEDGKMETKKLGAYVNDHPVTRYYVNGYPADNHEYVKVYKNYDAQEDVKWYQLNETEIMKMLGNSAAPETPVEPNVPDTPTVPSTPSDIGGTQKPSTPTLPTSPSDI